MTENPEIPRDIFQEYDQKRGEFREVFFEVLRHKRFFWNDVSFQRFAFLMLYATIAILLFVAMETLGIGLVSPVVWYLCVFLPALGLWVLSEHVKMPKRSRVKKRISQ